ncbi:hypothetical protein ACFXJ5_38620 [Streptomyces sp. NPDC059373]
MTHEPGGGALAAPGWAPALLVFAAVIGALSLRVALRPERLALTPRALGAGVAGAGAMALALCPLPAGPTAMPHLLAMVRFELLAGPGALLVALSARWTGGALAVRGGPLGAVLWTVALYAWHLPSLGGLAGPAAALGGCLMWGATGRWALAAHLAAVPLGCALVLTYDADEAAAGVFMLAVTAVMVAGLRSYSTANIGSNLATRGSFALRSTQHSEGDPSACATKRMSVSPGPASAHPPGPGCAATGSPSP